MSKKPYFKITAKGFDKELQREQVQINIGTGTGKVFLIKTDEGFIVDVYDGEDLIDTMAIFDDDLQPETIESNG
jgi:hypothetical protein